jgi:hypothetical protein
MKDEFSIGSFVTAIEKDFKDKVFINISKGGLMDSLLDLQGSATLAEDIEDSDLYRFTNYKPSPQNFYTQLVANLRRSRKIQFRMHNIVTLLLPMLSILGCLLNFDL